MGDTKQRDSLHIAKMVEDLKAIGYVHTFIITINSEENRASDQLQATIKLFSQIFGSDFFQNVLICFTRFSSAPKHLKLRAKGMGGLSKEKLIEQYQ